MNFYFKRPTNLNHPLYGIKEFCRPTFQKVFLFLSAIFLQLFTFAHSSSETSNHFQKDLRESFSLKQIRGKITDEDGNPLAGITITVKNSAIITTSNSQGEFVLKDIDEHAELVFTSANMLPYEFRLNGQQSLEIRLSRKVTSLENLDIVVSNGYQQIPKERSTGSFVQIDNKTFNYQTGSNVVNRLNGVSSSVLFPVSKVNAPVFTIRGLGSINGPKSPLIIVDNFPYEGDINNINPNDVENITILKDAAAASIWGARAGNGVIVISTKKGRFNQPVKVELNANVTVSDKPDLFYLPLISSSDYIDLEQQLYTKGYYNNQIISSSYPGLSPAVEIFIKKTNGLISASDSASQINALKTKDTRNDYLNYFYQPAINQQYALNIKGGSDNYSYFLSGAFDKNIDNLSAAYKKVNVHFDNIYKINKKLQLTAGFLFTNAVTNSGKPSYGSVKVGSTLIVPYLTFKDANGNAAAVAFNNRLGYIDTLGSGMLLDGHYYPLTNWEHNTTNANLLDITANLGLRYELLKGLKLESNYQFERQRLSSKNLADLQSYEAIGTINAFTQIDPATGTVNYIVPLGGILNLSQTDIAAHTLRGQLSYSQRFGKHAISVIGGSELRQVRTSVYTNTIYGFDDNLDTYGQVDFVNAYPTVGGGSGTITNGLSFQDLTNRFVSYYANAAYVFNNKYILNGSGRRDASNLFGVNANDKWNPLWSAGVAWNIDRETFYHLSLLQQLKFRLTYGFSGNVDPTRTAVTTLSINSGADYTNVNFALPSNYANPNLRWEKIGMLNAGFDFETKGKILSGTLEYYHKKGKDLFGPAQLDYTAGLLTSFVTKNVAAMEGNGIDVVLQTLNINKRLKWNSTILFNYYLDKVTEYYRPSALASAYITDGTSVATITGKPLYSIVSYKWAGLDPSGNPQGYLNGQLSKNYTGISSATNTKNLETVGYNGPASPVVYGSVMNAISWKGITLIANIAYKFGYYFRKASLNNNLLLTNGAYIGSGDYANRWKRAGDELKTNVPAFTYPASSASDAFYINSEATVLKADNIRLQFINLIYEFGGQKLARMRMEKIAVYLNISNVGLLWKANKEHIDPDYPSNIPPSKTITIGVRCNF